MKENIQKQFEQFFRMFRDIVNDYDEYSWNHIGHALTIPQRLSFHILQSIKYYSYDTDDFILKNGNRLAHDYKYENQISLLKDDIVKNIELQDAYLKRWIMELDFSSENTMYKWTGKDMESVVIFIIRHSYFHLGELNGLLNEYLKGKAKDHFAGNIW